MVRPLYLGVFELKPRKVNLYVDSPQFQRALNRVCQRRQIASQHRSGANSSGANARGCWPTALSTTMPASYPNCLSAPGAGRITTGRRDQASEPAKLEASEALRADSFLDIGNGGRPPGIDQSLGGSRGRHPRLFGQHAPNKALIS